MALFASALVAKEPMLLHGQNWLAVHHRAFVARRIEGDVELLGECRPANATTKMAARRYFCMDVILLSDSLLMHECIETYAKLRSSPARKKMLGAAR
jgi:hypothetical protein